MKLPIFALFLAAIGFAAPIQAAPTQAGPYRVEITTDPPTIPVGKADLRLKITDAKGQPIEGAQVKTLTKMPGMNMGERENLARPMPGEPGIYQAPAAFPMAGGYVSQIEIVGPKGSANAEIPLSTGQNTAQETGVSKWKIALWLAGAILVLFILFRVWKSGQKPNWRAVFNRQVLGGVALLAIMLAISVFAVRHFRRPGSMTPIEAQAMEMNLPAPEGTLAVELATVSRGPLSSAITYSGQVVGFNEQSVYPRVTGVLEWMPLYAGDSVKKGQLLARLDTSTTAPEAAEKQAGVGVAQENTEVARLNYQESLSAIRQAKAEADIKEAALGEARSDEKKVRANLKTQSGAVAEAKSMAKRTRANLSEAQNAVKGAQGALSEVQSDQIAAREAKIEAESGAEAAQAQIADAQASLDAAQADADYWAKEIERMRILVQGGASPRRELDLAIAAAETARAKVRAAQANLEKARAQTRGSQSNVRRAQATIQSAAAKEQQAQATIGGSEARIEAAQAEIAGADAKIVQAAAQLEAAKAEAGSAAARVRQAAADLSASRANIAQIQAAANAARGRIGQSQAQTRQAQAAAQGAAATLGYAEIRAQIDGVVAERVISPGVLVQPGQAILKIAQVQPIRLQANVAQSDLARIRLGATVTIQSRDNAKPAITTRVSTLAPSLDPAARTGIIEAIWPNKDLRFLPGQFVVMKISTGQNQDVLQVPTRAIQTQGEASYLWIAEPDSSGQFTVRRVEVKTGVSDGKNTQIVSGIEAGQKIVTAGGQFLRNGQMVLPPPIKMAENQVGQRISVTERRFEPASVAVKAGVPAKLVFTRKTEATCGTEVIFPDLKIEKKLPLNQAVEVNFTPKKGGELRFMCGMNMLKGKVMVE